MPFDLPQVTSVLELQCGAIRGAAHVLRIKGRERMSQCYRYSADVMLPGMSPAEAASALLGEPIVLSARSGGGEGGLPHARRIGGVVSHARLSVSDRTQRTPDVSSLAGAVAGVATSAAASGRMEDGVAALGAVADGLMGPALSGWFLRIRIVPCLWRLGRGRGHRIFQGMTVPQIAREVLEAGGVRVRFSLSREYEPRTYCTQYDESDLAFVERILADEGMAYSFELGEEESTETMVVGDGASPGGAAGGGCSLRFQSEGGMRGDSDAVFSLSDLRVVAPTTSAVGGFDYQRPLLDLSAQASRGADDLVESHGRVERHVGAWDGPRLGAERAQRRLAQDRRKARICSGTTRHVGLSAGLSFDLTGAPVSDLDGRYHVIGTDVVFDVTTPGPACHVGFECVPDPVVYRPGAPRRVLRQVLETATVVGPSAQEIHTDSLGRIRVRFHWDPRQAGDERSSCWIRCMVPWAGDGWGFQFIPRVGMEVVVGFLGGDVDTPVVLGCAPNAAHPPPYPLPGSKTRSGIKTRSSRNGDGYNELAFEDRVGHERLMLRAERDLDVDVRNDEVHRVAGTVTEHVQGNRFGVVGGNVLSSVQGNLTCSVAGNETLSVTGTRTTSIAGNEVTRVVGAREESIEGSSVRRVSGRERVAIGGSQEVTASHEMTLRAEGSIALVAGKASAPAAIVIHVDGELHATSTRRAEIAAEREVSIRCGDSHILVGPDRIELRSPSLLLSSGDAVVSISEGKVRAHADDEVMLRGDSKVVLKGSTARLSLDDDAKVEGQKVMLKSPDGAGLLSDEAEGEITRIELVDRDGRRLPNQRYRLVLADGTERTGVTNDEGRAEVRLTDSATVYFPDLERVEEG